MSSLRFALSAAMLGLGMVRLGAEDAPLRKPLITSELGGREIAFLRAANEHGVLMNYLADLAKTKGSNTAVAALGDLLLSTQSEENSRLVQLAANKGVTFRAATPPAMKDLQKVLGKVSGVELNTAVLEALREQVIGMVENYETGSAVKDADVKSFAVEGLQLARDKQAIIQKVAGYEFAEACAGGGA